MLYTKCLYLKLVSIPTSYWSQKERMSIRIEGPDPFLYHCDLYDIWESRWRAADVCPKECKGYEKDHDYDDYGE